MEKNCGFVTTSRRGKRNKIILDDDINKSKELYYISNNSSLNDLDINSILLNIDLNKGELKIYNKLFKNFIVKFVD